MSVLQIANQYYCNCPLMGLTFLVCELHIPVSLLQISNMIICVIHSDDPDIHQSWSWLDLSSRGDLE